MGAILAGVGGIQGSIPTTVAGAMVTALAAGFIYWESQRPLEPRHRLGLATVDVTNQSLALRLSDGTDPVGRFVGRSWLTRQVDDYLDGHDSGYIVIRAEAGMGKSAYAFYLASTRRYPLHMSRASGEGRKPFVARRNLGAQLIQAWGLRDFVVDGGIPPDAGSVLWFEQVLNAAGVAAASRERRLVLVVDGLDEAYPVPLAEATGVPFALPGSLPATCFIIATTRPGVSMRPQEGSHQAKLEIDVEGKDNRNDLREFIGRTLSTGPFPEFLRSAQLTLDDAVDDLDDRAGGVWIYATTVLEDIERGNSHVDSVRSLPFTLSEYYDASVARWETSGDWQSVGATVVATLSISRKPLSLDDLTSWTGGLSRSEIVRWVNGPLRAFLAERVGAWGTAFEVRHESFREFIEKGPSEQLDDPKALVRREQLAAACRDAHQRAMHALLPPPLEQ